MVFFSLLLGVGISLNSLRLPIIKKTAALLVLPTIGWFFWFLLIPLGIVGAYSFSTKGTYGGVEFHWNLDNYARAAEWVYLRVLGNSLLLASLTAFFCLLLGYPMAYVMVTAPRRWRSFLLILVVIPFWTNFVVRAYATKLLFTHLHSDSWIVLVGMVTNYLPFMILPLYVSIEKFDFTLMEAARDLGATPVRVVKSILIPLTKKGIFTGLTLVFTPALGEFVIPDLLGGARTMLIGNLITEQFLKTRDWPFGSALSLLLVLVVMLSVGFFLSFQGRDEETPVSHET
jgi:spermidine/putrescine transport system permease protein